MNITIYGIKNCSTMKKAFNKLDELGVTYDFHGYKKQAIGTEKLQKWVSYLGLNVILNQKGTTWRNLADEQKQFALASQSNAIQLMAENSSLIKRPIIEIEQNGETQYLVGYDEGKYGEMFE